MNMLERLSGLGQWAMALGQHPRLLLAGGAGLVVLVVTANIVGARKARVPLTTHGTARWSLPKERRKSGLSLTSGVVIGESDDVIYCDNWVTHLLTVGRSRSGKGMFHIRPTLRWFWPWSVMVTDPKNGENLRWSRAEREALGQRIEVFAPYRSSPTKINVSDSIRFGKPEEYRDALAVGSSLTAPDKMKGENASSLHFRELAAKVIGASQLHVWYTSGSCSLGRTWHFLTQQQAHDDVGRLQATLKALATTMHTSRGVHQAVMSISNALSVIGSREMGSIWSTATRPLYLYNDFYVAQATDTSTLDLRELQFGAQPMSLYLTGESPKATEDMGAVYRSVIDTAITVLMRRDGDALPDEYTQRVLLCLDELPVYGYIPSVAGQVSTIAGYGMKGWFLVQDIPQLDDTYGSNNAIWSNTDTKIFHAPGNDETAARISDLLGEQTVEYAVASQGGGMRGQGTVTPHRQKRPLLTQDEIQNAMAPGLGIVQHSGRGLYPWQFTKLGYDPQYQGDT